MHVQGSNIGCIGCIRYYGFTSFTAWFCLFAISFVYFLLSIYCLSACLIAVFLFYAYNRLPTFYYMFIVLFLSFYCRRAVF